MEQSLAWDIVVIGGAYTDYVVRGPELPTTGETVRALPYHIASRSKSFFQMKTPVQTIDERGEEHDAVLHFDETGWNRTPRKKVSSLA